MPIRKISAVFLLGVILMLLVTACGKPTATAAGITPNPPVSTAVLPTVPKTATPIPATSTPIEATSTINYWNADSLTGVSSSCSTASQQRVRHCLYCKAWHLNEWRCWW